MAFLLDEHCPWPPHLVDGFDNTRKDAPASADAIRALRLQLQQARVVSWFTTPTDLEARVSAAVTTAGLTAQLDVQPATALDPMAGVAGDSSAEQGIRNAIVAAADRQRALKIDLATLRRRSIRYMRGEPLRVLKNWSRSLARKDVSSSDHASSARRQPGQPD